MSERVKLYGINRLRESLVVAESTRRSMQGNKSRETKPEVALRLALWHSGLRGYRKNVKPLPGTPDIVFGRSKVAMFVHGCFWHGHDCPRYRTPRQNQQFWIEKVFRNEARHNRNVLRLQELGYQTLTVWECELKNGTADIIRQLEGILAKKP